MADLLHIDGLPFVGEAGIAGDDEEPADAGEGGDDLLDHAVGEILLLRVAAHIGEGQYRDRRLVRERQRWWSSRLDRGRLARRRPGRPRSDTVDAHGPGYVLDLLLAQILEDEGQPVAHLVVNRVRDEHPAGI